MDPVLIAAILSLAGIVITTFGPSLVRITQATIDGKNPVSVLAQEDVSEILHANTHIDDAMAVVKAHEAAMQLRAHVQANAELSGMDVRQKTTVALAIAAHDMVLAGTTIWP